MLTVGSNKILWTLKQDRIEVNNSINITLEWDGS